MSRQLPAVGDYTAECTAPLKVIIAETGTYGIAVAYKLVDSETPFSDTHVVYIAKADGTKLEASIDNLKKVFNWDGKNPWELVFNDPETEQDPRDYKGLQFKLKDCKHEDYEGKDGNTYTSFRPSFLNPMEGGRNFQLADRATFMKAFGAKFRASAGGTTKKPEPKPTDSKPAAGPPPRKSNKPAAPPCSMEEAYGAFKSANKGKTDDALGDVWYSKIEELWPGVDAEKLTKEQYGELRAALTA